MKTVIYHNKRCSKSRQTLALLGENGVDAEVIDYLEQPPSVAELERIVGLLGIRPSELVRFKEARASALGIKRGDDRSDREWIELLVANPILIERPIVVRGGKAALGRPPESVLEIL